MVDGKICTHPRAQFKCEGTVADLVERLVLFAVLMSPLGSYAVVDMQFNEETRAWNCSRDIIVN